MGGYFLGFLAYLIFTILSILVFQTFMDIESWSPGYPTLINSLVVIIISAFIRLNIRKIDDKTPLNNPERIASYIMSVNWFIFSNFILAIGVFVIFFIPYIISGISIIKPLSIEIISVMALVTATFVSYANRRVLLYDVKDLLNERYVETFPKVGIKTNSMILEGKICDIFNDDMIILDDLGVKKAVDWDSIKYMELKG
jgi:hypothetical protein